MADAPPGAKFTFLDYVGLAFILVGGEEILRRPKEGWPIWIPGLVLGCVALALRDRSPQLVGWFRSVGTAKKTSKLVISSASYSAWSGQGKRYDVTKYLRSIVTGDSLVFDRIENHSFWVDGQNLVPEDPLYGKPKKLEVTYSYDGEPPKTIRRTEGDRLTLPEDSAMAWLGNELNKAKAEIDGLKAAQPKPLQYPIPPLRSKVLEMVSALQGFLGSHGGEPEVKQDPQEEPLAYMQRWRQIIEPWRTKFRGDYRIQFGESVPRLRDEILSRAAIDDWELNAAIEKAANNPNHIVESVANLARRLYDLGYFINA